MSRIDLQVKITRKDIDEGVPGEARKCAIAFAVVNSDPDIVWANATTKWIKFGRASDEMQYTYRTPLQASMFIKSFDEGYTPQPFDLVLTNEDLVSIRPRQMHQREKADSRVERTYAAKILNKPVDEVSKEEVADLREELAQAGKDIPLSRPRVKTPKTGRKYAKRPTTVVNIT